jgi:hypothetical protein
MKPILTPEISAAVEALQIVLGEQKQIQKSIARAAQDRDEASHALAEANERVERLDSDIASLRYEGQEIPAAVNKELTTLRGKARTAEETLEQMARIQSGLNRKLQTASDAVSAAQKELLALTAPYREALLREYRAELCATLQDLAARMREGIALSFALGHAPLREVIGEILVGDPMRPAVSLIHGNLANLDPHSITGSRPPEDLASTWRNDADAIAIFELLAPVFQPLVTIERGDARPFAHASRVAYAAFR